MNRPVFALLMLSLVGAAHVLFSFVGAAEVPPAGPPNRRTTFGDLIRVPAPAPGTIGGAVWRNVAMTFADSVTHTASGVLEIDGLGPVGALDGDGFLGSPYLLYPNGFAANDVAVFGRQLFAAGDISGQARLVVLRSSANGTFTIPQVVPLFSIPNAITADDIDLDGLPDAVVGEAGNAIEVFTGSFLQLGIVTPFDRSDLAVVRQGGNPAVASDPITMASGRFGTGGPVLSVTTARLDGDAFGDLAYAMQSGTNEFAFVLLTSTSGFTSPAILVGSGGLPAGSFRTDLIDAAALNICPPSGTPDATPDIAVAVSNGVELIRTIPNAVDPLNGDPTFIFAGIAGAGTNPTGVVLADITSDNLVDIIVLNAGSGNITTNVARPSPIFGYGAAIPTVTVGANPVSMSEMNFNNDGIPDVVVASPGSAGGTVFQGNGSGGFTTARTFDTTSPTSVAAGSLRLDTQGEDVVIGSDSGIAHLSNLASGFVPNLVRGFPTSSDAATLDGSGSLNDVVLIEQFGNLTLSVSPSARPADAFVVRNLDGAPGSPSVTEIRLENFSAAVADQIATSVTTIGSISLSAIPADIAITTVPLTGGSGRLLVLTNDGTGTFSNPAGFQEYTITSGATHVLAGDVNTDGRNDLIYFDSLASDATILLSTPSGGYSPLPPFFTGGAVPVDAQFADVNDDDRIDLVVLNQGSVIAGDQSTVNVFLGDNTGLFTPLGAPLAVPNYALSLAGGDATPGTGISRITDFNLDGFTDFVVASTRGATTSASGSVPALSILLNQPGAPGNFIVQPPIALVDSSIPERALRLESAADGPGFVSGYGGDPSFPGVGAGGASSILNVGDYNADAAVDVVVSGTTRFTFDANGDKIGDTGSGVDGVPGVPPSANFRASLYLMGDHPGPMLSPGALRVTQYATGVFNPLLEAGDTFVASATGNFAPLANGVPDVSHLSLNGDLWVDANTTPVTNHAPFVTIPRANLNAPLGQGRKYIITSGQTGTIDVVSSDADSDSLLFRLVPTPTGEQPPSFLSINAMTGQITINSANINTGPSPVQFRIIVEATDSGASPLSGRDAFTLVVNPGSAPASPPTISSVTPNAASPGAQVTIVGTGFMNGAAVSFGGTPATAVSFVDATTLLVIVPTRPAGPAPVTVTNPDAQSATFNGFVVIVLTIGGVQPISAPPGSVVTITGTGFVTGSAVDFGSIPALNVVIVDSTTLFATVPVLAAGPVTITITPPGGQPVSFVGFAVLIDGIPTLSQLVLLLLGMTLAVAGAVALKIRG